MTDLDYLREAYLFAETNSTDPSTQNGAILVNDEGMILTYGANHFPRGVKESPERWARPPEGKKYLYVEHAERNAIFAAARSGIKTEGTIMYCPWYSCVDCGRAIIQAGIKEVVGHRLPEHNNNPRWTESIKEAHVMFEEAGVKARWVEGKIGGCKILFDEKIVEP